MKLLNILIIFAFLNVFLWGGGLLLAEYTGDLLLEGNLIPERTFEASVPVNDLKDITFIFSAPEVSASRMEWLKITLTYPNGSKSSWKKGFETSAGEAIWSKSVDYTFIITPAVTGIYYLKITDTEFPTHLRIKSGMINVLENELFAVFWSIFWAIILFPLGWFRQKKNYKDSRISKEDFLVALVLSLIITYFAIYYSSSI